MKELSELREATEDEVGLCTEADYALIYDERGVPWATETLLSGERVKRRLSVDGGVPHITGETQTV